MPLLPPSDARLVEQALAANADAFDALVRRHQKRAHAIARATGLRGGSVDDVVQEAFLAAFQGLGSLKEWDAFGSWLLGIVRNLGRKRLAADCGTAVAIAAQPTEASTPAPVEILEQRELSDLLWRKVAELPESLREAVYLYYHEGESIRAVAAALGISREAAKSRLQRGREALRSQLWSELRQSLRDMLPAARGWKQKGRRLTLLIVATSAPESMAAAQAAVVPNSAAAGSSCIMASCLGGILMGAKQAALAGAIAVVVLCAVGGIVVISASNRGTAGPPRLAASHPGDGLPVESENTPVSTPGAVEPPRPLTPSQAIVLLELRDLRTDELIDPGSARIVVEPPGAAEIAVKGVHAAAQFEPASGPVTLTFLVRGYTEETVEIVPLAAKEAPEPIYLDPGICITGRVTEKVRGEPVAGAAVAALRVAKTRNQSLEEDPLSVARTDETGAFRLTGIEPGEQVVLRAEAREHAVHYQEAVLPTAEDLDGVQIELEPGFTLSGTVQAEDPVLASQLTRAKLILQPDKSRDWPAYLATSRTIELTSREGADEGMRFELHGLPAGTYRLNVEPEDAAFARDNWTEPMQVGDQSGFTELVVLVSGARTITGTILTSEGKPFRAAVVCLSEPAEEATLFCERTGEDGSFTLRRARRGKAYKLLVWSPSPAAKGRRYEILRDADVYVLDPDPQQETLRIKSFFRGEDISQASLSYVFFDRPEAPSACMQGMFIPAKHNLPLEGYRKFVFYGRKGPTHFVPKLIDLQAGGSTEVELEMEEGATLRGRVVTADGTPIQSATVDLSSMDLGRWHATATIATDGSFELKGLPLDIASIRVTIKDAGDWRPQGELAVSSYAEPVTFVLVREQAGETLQK